MKFNKIIKQQKLDEVKMSRIADNFDQIKAVMNTMSSDQKLVIIKSGKQFHFYIGN